MMKRGEIYESVVNSSESLSQNPITTVLKTLSLYPKRFYTKEDTGVNEREKRVKQGSDTVYLIEFLLPCRLDEVIEWIRSHL